MGGVPMPAVGVTTVPCPVCRAAVARPCRNRRGYLLDAGSHVARWAAWMNAEQAEAREVRASRATVQGATPGV